MWLTRFSIQRPIIVAMFFIALGVYGLFSFFQIGRSLNPNVNFPIVVVSATYPGASPLEMERLVIKPIEDQIDGIDNLDQLSAEGKVIDDSMTPFGKVGVGVAVSLSAPQPNIGSTEGLRHTLIDARTVAYIDPAMGGTSGIYVARLFQQLGIGSQMQAKSVLVHDGLAGQAVARGQAEIALQQASELRLVPSIKFAGLLPEAVQNWTVYTGALSPAARSKDAALTLMSALSDPGLEPMLKRRGLEAP